MGSNLALTMFLYGALAPALSAAGLAAAARKSEAWRHLLIGAAALSGLLLVYGGQFRWPPAQALDWMVLLLPALTLAAWLPLPTVARWLLPVAMLAAGTFLMFQPALAMLDRPWLTGLLILVLWSAYLRPADEEAMGSNGALLATAIMLALTVGLSGSALLAQALGATAANLAGVGMVALVTGSRFPLQVFRALLFGLAMVALFYAQIDVALCILPLATGMLAAPLVRGLIRTAPSPLKAELSSFALALLLASPGVIYAIQKKLSQPAGYY